MFEVPPISELLWLLPGAAVAVLCLIAAGTLARRGHSIAALLCGGLAFGLCHVVTWWVTRGNLPLPPATGSERMLWAIPAVGLGAVLATGLRFKRRVIVLHYVLAGGLVYVLLRPLLERAVDDPSRVTPLALLLIVGIVLAVQAVVEEVADRVKGPALLFVLAMAFGLGAQMLFAYGSFSLAQLGGAAAIALGAGGLVVRLLPDGGLPRVCGAACAGLAAGIFVDGYYFMTDPPPLAALLLLFGAPATLAVAQLRPFAKLTATQRLALLMALALIPVGIALWIAIAHLPPPDPYGEFK